MKVVMLKTGEIKEVKEGYAQNYLIPNKLAVSATAGALRLAEERKKAHTEQLTKLKTEDEVLHQNLKDLTLKLEAKANGEGGLFAALGVKDICAALFSQKKIMLKEEDIVLPENIKKVGSYSAEISTQFGRKSKINLTISALKE